MSYYVVSLLGKSNRGRKFKPEDFLPPWFREHVKDDGRIRTPEQLKAALDLMVEVQNANDQHANR